jgi:hypothetical protein
MRWYIHPALQKGPNLMSCFTPDDGRLNTAEASKADNSPSGKEATIKQIAWVAAVSIRRRVRVR